MRSTIIILLAFLLCSCKTREIASEVKYNQKIQSNISTLNEHKRIDTTKTKIVEQTEEFTRIVERETITEYDTEKQTPSKVFEKEKILEQGKQTKTDKDESKGLADTKKDSANCQLNSDIKANKKEDVKEEPVTKGMFDNLGKWLGIGIASIILIALVWKKIKKFIPP